MISRLRSRDFTITTCRALRGNRPIHLRLIFFRGHTSAEVYNLAKKCTLSGDYVQLRISNTTPRVAIVNYLFFTIQVPEACMNFNKSNTFHIAELSSSATKTAFNHASLLWMHRPISTAFRSSCPAFYGQV